MNVGLIIRKDDLATPLGGGSLELIEIEMNTSDLAIYVLKY